jgi:hypothetical protein
VLTAAFEELLCGFLQLVLISGVICTKLPELDEGKLKANTFRFTEIYNL